METFGDMCQETALGKAGAEESQSPARLIYRPAGALTPNRHNWNVGGQEALAQREFRQIIVLFARGRN